ncbi:hypothetical protein Btru_023455 [Bulinus truncatus]|nr:hypothetical protein Btru_023455 [Bulinus truncatus]
MGSLRLFCLVLLCHIEGSLSATKDRNEILSEILQRANVLRLPSIDDQPVKVTVVFALLNIQGVDTKPNAADIVVWTNLFWTDKSLSWSKECTPFKFISVPADRIWTPNLTVYNSLITPDISSSNEVRVNKNGSVLQMLKLHVQVPCNVTLLDGAQSTCGLKLGPWAWSNQELVLDAKGPVYLEGYFPTSKYEVRSATQKVVHMTYPVYSPDTFEIAELDFTFANAIQKK